jgi:hypothetical protein
MNGILKWPLLITALMVILRVVLEQSGVPDSVNNLLSVAGMTVLIVPLYLAIRIAKSGAPRPFVTLFKLTALFAIAARAMVLPTYWLARIYGWPQGRFVGSVEPEQGALVGFVIVPVVTGLFWVVSSVVIGGGLASIALAVLRKVWGKPAVSGLSAGS